MITAHPNEDEDRKSRSPVKGKVKSKAVTKWQRNEDDKMASSSDKT